jgi:hypothetical protein
MTDHEQKNGLNKQLAAVEMALRPNGILYEIAQTALDEPIDLTPQEAGDVILKRKSQGGEPIEARWQLLEEADKKIVDTANLHVTAIYELAEQFGNRKSESLPDEELAKIDLEMSIWTVESGANRTSVVRRQLAIDAMYKIYGPDNLEDKTLFQFGGPGVVPYLRADESVNPAHAFAQEVAPDFLTEGNDFTEFDLNLATALQSGYEVLEDITDGIVANRVVMLRKAGNPQLILMQPKKTELGGLDDGFTAVANYLGSQNMAGKQLVISTNGQYRLKDELQARRWASTHDVNMLPAVALGDEPGYVVSHNGNNLTTANRAPIVYLNDFIVLSRMAAQEQA